MDISEWQPSYLCLLRIHFLPHTSIHFNFWTDCQLIRCQLVFNFWILTSYVICSLSDWQKRNPCRRKHFYLDRSIDTWAFSNSSHRKWFDISVTTFSINLKLKHQYVNTCLCQYILDFLCQIFISPKHNEKIRNIYKSILIIWNELKVD